MVDFPAYVRVIFDYAEDFDPSVRRVEMDRGVPKQIIVNRKVLQEIQATLYFDGASTIDAFETWYFDEIDRIGYFNMRHPRTKQIIPMRIKGGKLGPLQPAAGGFHASTRQVTLEYLR